jgi:hypothetical protein
LDSSACWYGSRETTEHLLLACPERGDSRKKLKQDLEGIKLFLRTLLHIKLGIEKTLGFIETIRFATRKWHLDKGGEDSPRGGSPGGPEARDIAGSEARDEKGTSNAN